MKVLAKQIYLDKLIFYDGFLYTKLRNTKSRSDYITNIT